MSHVKRLALLILAFLALGFTYGAVTPVFEAPDEVWHYNYLRYIAEGHGLPSMHNNDHGAYQEAAQPPLYYLITALITAPIPDDDKDELLWHNPRFGYQAPGTVNDNKNMLIHTQREAWPWRDFTLALHLARLVSLAFGALTVLATWALARAVFPTRPWLALAAAGVVACMPQFVFISSVASNDSSAAALSTAALWSMLRLRRQPLARGALLTGALIGLAWLTKTSALLLLPVGIVASGRWKVESGRWKVESGKWEILYSLKLAALVTLATLLVGGWWYARNFILYGDALGLSAHINTPWGRPQPVSLFAILPELPRVYRSFWAAFGWGGIEWPVWVYCTLGVLILLSIIGYLFPHPSSFILRPSSLILPATWFILILAALLRWMTQVEAPHGRLLFPAIGAVAILLVGGWANWRKGGRALIISNIGFLGALTLISPFTIIRPALLPPPLLTEAQVYARADKIQVVYGDEIELIGWRQDKRTARPGDWVIITLCWQALKPIANDYTMFVHLLGQDNLVVGARDTWPGLGKYPTSLWIPNHPFCDDVRVRVETWTPTPAVYAVETGFYDAQAGARLELPDSSVPIIGQLVVRDAPPPPPQHATSYDLDGKIALIGYDAPAQVQAGQPFTITLHWQAQMDRLDDYTVFVHVLDENGQLITQRDARPRNETYPTWAWAKSESVADPYIFALPAGLYTLKVGMYHRPDMSRLPVRDHTGPIPDNAIVLPTLQVNP